MLTGYEINKDAANQASKYNIAKIYNKSILEEITEKPSDLTFTVGVLIHINPDYRNLVYDNLVSKSKRYIVIVEYYNHQLILFIEVIKTNCLSVFCRRIDRRIWVNLPIMAFFTKEIN